MGEPYVERVVRCRAKKAGKIAVGDPQLEYAAVLPGDPALRG